MKLITTLLLLILSSGSCYAEQISVGADEWRGYTHADGSGIYFELLNKIYPEYQLQFKLDSFNRALTKFEQKNLDIIIGVYKEDLQHALFPNWYLDTEYPIKAFYDKKRFSINKLSDLSTLTTSWLRGYAFDRYLPKLTNSYLVDDVKLGFKLLANKRIDAFIDYSYNLPEEYQQAFSSFEVLPSRHVYIAFQRNKHGKKLALQFDQKMTELRHSGELERLFTTDYQRSGLADFNPIKNALLIYTDEANLLTEQHSNELILEPGLNQILNLAFDSLDDYRFTFKLINDFSKIYAFKNSDNVCFTDMIKTKQRQENFIFSEPFSLYLGLHLYSKIAFPPQEITSLKQLLATNKQLNLGIISGRSYGEDLDQQLKHIDSTQLYQLPVETGTALKQLNNDRFQLLIEYPSEIGFYWPQISSEPINSAIIPAAEAYILGHMMCAESNKTSTFLRDFNLSLQKLYPTQAFFQAQLQAVTKDNKTEFTRYFNQVFK